MHTVEANLSNPRTDLTDITVLLIQVRETEEVAEHERLCVLEQAGLAPQQVDAVNVPQAGVPEWPRVQRADAVIIGGAGGYSVVEDHPFMPPLADSLHRMIEANLPILGSCWGHQFIAQALGGAVIHDPERKEVGTAAIELTEAAAGDALFANCPQRFDVLMGHEDRITRLPPDGIELARSRLCRFQAFRIEGRPIYGTQFHTELSPERLIERLTRYRKYMPDDDEFAALQTSIRPTIEASALLRRFLELFCGTRPRGVW